MRVGGHLGTIVRVSGAQRSDKDSRCEDWLIATLGLTSWSPVDSSWRAPRANWRGSGRLWRGV